ncbi:O-antigen/teichoic acid export membrane protein [Microlunatus panaciterrae]|uniref:O-antigen/teichoic acid export membrane protein n=1 Tax=Microlunatus panaciterrae TaxID=400768 RepID=A0ABS2RHM7_9ACTN|nr:O-antigen/teichoic acid export membrane protein [Microlunatus panaciterrae]
MNDGTSYSLSGTADGVGVDEDLARQGDPPRATVSQQAASGVVWLTIQKWATRLLGFVTIAILTRLLSPEDFGAVAAATTVLPFFYLLADFGFAAYIVQADRADQRLLSTGFWFSTVAGFGLGGALVLIAPLFGLVYRGSQTVPILQVLALSMLITALSSVPNALLRRSMRFATIASQGTISAVIGQVAAIIMAVAGLGAWALVGQTLASGLVGSVLAWIAAKWRPSFVFSRGDFITMARYGGQVLGVEFVAVLRAWAEAAIVSASLGMAALGYLSIAQRLVLIVQELTGGALIPVSTVAFAKIRDSRARLTSAYLRASRVTYTALSLPLIMVAVAAPLIVPIVFGDGWSLSSQLAQILALAGTLTVGASLDHGLFYGTGKPGVWFVYAVIIDAVTVSATAIAVHWGLLPVAWAFLAVAFAATSARWFLVARLLQTHLRTVTRPFIFLCLALGVTGASGWGMVSLTAALPPMGGVALVGVVVFSVHLILVRLVARDVIEEATLFVRRSKWARFLAPPRVKVGRDR